MNGRKRVVLVCLVLAFLAMGLAARPHVSWAQTMDNRSYILTTATTGGTYYPVGVALATLTKIKLEPETGVSLSAISSAGSAENVRLLRLNEAQFAILQGIYGAWAWNGTGPLAAEGRQSYLRSVTLLWRNAEHFVVRADLVSSGTMDDLNLLKGKKFSIGSRNSGAEASNRYILRSLGIDPDTALTPVHQGYSMSADSLQNGTIMGMSTPAGVPVSAVTRAFAAPGSDLRILSFTEQQLALVNAQFPLWSFQIIEADTYPGQTFAVQTIGHSNFLAVRADVDADAVYKITKAIYDNLDFLNNIHKATTDMALEKAVQDLPAPLHPGAAQFYSELGLEIPETLLPPSE